MFFCIFILKFSSSLLKDKNLDYVEVIKAGSSGGNRNNAKLSVLNGSISSNKNSEEDRHFKK